MGRLIVVIALCLHPVLALAQVDPAPGDPLDEYLYQAFAAPSHAARTPIFHLGVQGFMEPGGYRLSAVLEGFPAHRAGLRRGDVISQANGAEFHPLESFDSGTTKLLTVIRNDSELEVSISPVRANLFDSYRQATLNSIQQFSVGNKVIGYLRLWALSRNTADVISLRRLVETLEQTDGLILDVRDGYGFYGPEHLALFRGNRGDNFYAKPIALLVNERSRGGLPLLAERLADLDRVITMGTAYGNDAPTEPEVVVIHPVDESSRSDPVYQTAVDVLLGVI